MMAREQFAIKLFNQIIGATYLEGRDFSLPLTFEIVFADDTAFAATHASALNGGEYIFSFYNDDFKKVIVGVPYIEFVGNERGEQLYRITINQRNTP